MTDKSALEALLDEDREAAVHHKHPVRYVYLAGPLTNPSPMHNAHVAMRAADELLGKGFAVFVPHLTILWDMVTPRHYEDWMALDFAWIERCDALVRIPGLSPGSDREVAHAMTHGIPVFFGVEKFLAQYPRAA